MSQAQDYESVCEHRGRMPSKYSAYGDYLGYLLAPGEGGLNGADLTFFHPDGSVLVTGFSNTTIKDTMVDRELFWAISVQDMLLPLHRK